MKLTIDLFMLGSNRITWYTYEDERPLAEIGGLSVRASMPGNKYGFDNPSFEKIDQFIRENGIAAIEGMSFQVDIKESERLST